MPLQLEIVSEHKEHVGDDAVRVFREDGGTIGRALENDWILPDPDKYISGRHATIDCKGGIYYLVDTSSNGVYVNDENEPIGKGNPRRLFNGDVLHLGDFEITVSIDEGEDLEIPEPPPPTVVPDHIEQLVPEVTLKTGIALLDEEEITGDEEFQSALFGSSVGSLDSDLPATPAPANESSGIHDYEDVGPVRQPQRMDASAEGLFAAFLDGLGVARRDLHPSLDAAEAMRNAGQVLREYVGGTEKLLQNRADLKTTFHLDQTAILPKRNNPLKLSQNTEDSIRQLLVGREGEYLAPKDAVKEVCRDLLVHQEAFLDAMTAAFIDFAERFDPEELVESFDNTMKRKPLFQFLADGKYWQLYRDLYPIMTEKGGGRFPQMFAEEFVKAYERQVADALRPDRAVSLAETQKLDRSAPIPPEDEAEIEATLSSTVADASSAVIEMLDDEIDEPTLEEELRALPEPGQAEA